MLLLLASACGGMVRPEPPSLVSHRLPPVRTDLDADLRRVTLYNRAGAITVRNSERAELVKHLTVCAESREEALAFGEDCKVLRESDGRGNVTITMDRQVELPLESIGSDLELRLPERRGLELRSRSGLIDTSLYVADDVSIGTQSGLLRLGESRGRLQFQSNSGDIEMLGRFREASGLSESASLDVRRPEPGAKLRFETDSGLTVLRIPSGLPVLVTFRTLRGKLVPELPVQRERLSEPAPGRAGYSSWRIQIQGEGIREGRVPFEAEISSESGALRLVRAAELDASRPVHRAPARVGAHAARPPE